MMFATYLFAWLLACSKRRDHQLRSARISACPTALGAFAWKRQGFEGYEYTLDAVRQHIWALSSANAPRVER
jgi:hypothetical protein